MPLSSSHPIMTVRPAAYTRQSRHREKPARLFYCDSANSVRMEPASDSARRDQPCFARCLAGGLQSCSLIFQPLSTEAHLTNVTLQARLPCLARMTALSSGVVVSSVLKSNTHPNMSECATPNSIATGARPRTGTPSRIALCVARDRLHAVRAGRSPRAG